jgi:hypothetical protein
MPEKTVVRRLNGLHKIKQILAKFSEPTLWEIASLSVTILKSA